MIETIFWPCRVSIALGLLFSASLNALHHAAICRDSILNFGPERIARFNVQST